MTSRPPLIQADSSGFRKYTASARSTPKYTPRAVPGAPIATAPAIAGTASRFSAPYFVSGIWNARINALPSSTTTRPYRCVIHRGSCASETASKSMPASPTVRA